MTKMLWQFWRPIVSDLDSNQLEEGVMTVFMLDDDWKSVVLPIGLVELLGDKACWIGLSRDFSIDKNLVAADLDISI